MEQRQGSYTEQDYVEWRKLIDRRPNASVWTTADGMEIPYRHLKYDHILNIITFVERYKGHYESRCGIQKTEKILRDMKRLKDYHISKMGSIGKILYGDKTKV